MSKTLSETLFGFERETRPGPRWQRCSAKDLGLLESWFRDAIFEDPAIVIEACRAANVTDDDWYPWAREFRVSVGPIDVLLVSSQGRVAIVETKLSSNPELRRQVLAQALDYLSHLADALGSMPSIPVDASGHAVADIEDIRESVSDGDVLLIVASDDIDSRVAKLSQSLIADNLVKRWDLALVDMALFKPLDQAWPGYLVVPTVRNLVVSETRQVVRVLVQGETPRARIQVERAVPELEESGRRKWDEDQFAAALTGSDVSPRLRELSDRLRSLAERYPSSVSLSWGTGRHGSMVLKRNGYGLIEVHGSGDIRFRPHKFVAALGETVGGQYRAALDELAPEAMRSRYPLLWPKDAAALAPQLYELVERSLAAAETVHD